MKDIKVKNGKLRKAIKEVLVENDTLTLATSDRKHPWAATLIYAFDEEFNLYFMSEKTSRHSRELDKNPVVAVAIHDKSGKMKGLQIQGKAGLVEKSKIPWALGLFWERFPWAKDWVSSPKQLLSKAFSTRIYRVQPEKIYFLDKERFGSDVRQVLDLDR